MLGETPCICTNGDKGRNDRENRDEQDRDCVHTYLFVLERIDGGKGGGFGSGEVINRPGNGHESVENTHNVVYSV